MNANLRGSLSAPWSCAWPMLGIILACVPGLAAETPESAKDAAQVTGDASGNASPCEPAKLGSPYIPVDSWVYPAMLRLYSLGYVDTVFLGLRPWTRASVMHMLENAGDLIEDSEDNGDPGAGQAREIYDAINRELHDDMEGPCGA